ncbi:MAG TPA: DUF418 domain-containing protein [Pyrinomonadaceae bacterium]|nr:DUF418 domain-containing protein [Pyrinomonadaceae bacterium]
MSQAVNNLVGHSVTPKDHDLQLTIPFDPIASSDRIPLLDVLRGFALFGVLLANMFWSFNGFAFVSPERGLELTASSIDLAAFYFIRFFIDKKFIMLFSLLFGFGFAVQAMRAEEKGGNIAVFYSRRQLILFFIGAVHLTFFWHGDILHVYAMCGLFLLAFVRTKARTLLMSAVVVSVIAVVAMMLVLGFQALASSVIAVGPGDSSLREVRRQFQDQLLAAFAHGSYGEMLEWNARQYFQFLLSASFLYILPATLGRFLLGFYAGRRRLLHNVAANLPFFRKLFWWSLPVGLVGSGLFLLGTELQRLAILDPVSLGRFLLIVPTEIGSLALCLFYVAALTLLYQRSTGQRLLSVLAPLGRMALTNYLMQTVICLVIFYGGRQITQVGPAKCVLLALVIFTVQVMLSTWWLQLFKMGPVEWLWRTLSYGQVQPLVRQTRTAVASSR